MRPDRLCFCHLKTILSTCWTRKGQFQGDEDGPVDSQSTTVSHLSKAVIDPQAQLSCQQIVVISATPHETSRKNSQFANK
jgi:hypothetical protein